MYYVAYSTNRLELALPGWNVWRVKSNNRKGQSSYRILEIIIGGRRRPSENVSIVDSHMIVDDEKQVIKLLFEASK